MSIIALGPLVRTPATVTMNSKQPPQVTPATDFNADAMAELKQLNYVLPDDAAEVESVDYEDKTNLAKSQHPSENLEYAGVDYETKKWSNTINVRFRFCSLRYDLKTDMLKHITRVRATIRELVDMSKEMTESEVVEWLVIALPDSGSDNTTLSSTIPSKPMAMQSNTKLLPVRSSTKKKSALKGSEALPDPPTPGHADKHKALTSALLNEEEKRRERKRGNRHDERHDRPRDAERKRTYEAMGIEDMTLEINALQTRLTELSDKPRKTGDSLL
ncbi:hypothetical protein H257_06382 [Aphanomyces astaci]|uniref:Uncharacterized protein n=1 Tax=Aphanomyces astaci TaxID=112090 RepID=W4GMM5_APHAT|nr:hypothetical protein H257_06382 [Aphanomyces astaci]ETV80937.1 hypothetical protein H257_06382 [Aphanomyces astaci]|eukprot:XP_009829884.1 hypothetical protein H257_06382 [Aphanomyces astaci]